MKILLFRLLKICGIALLFLLIGLIVFIFFTGPKLPANTDTIIENVINTELPEFVKGKSGYVISDDHKIWYESITPKDSNKGVILLFMGMATDALGWPQTFGYSYVKDTMKRLSKYYEFSRPEDPAIIGVSDDEINRDFLKKIKKKGRK